jgi:acyl carrier protein
MLRDELVTFIRDNLTRGQGAVGVDDSLIDRGLIDSLGLMRIITFLEQRTAVRIPDHYVTPDNFQSATTIERMVESLRAESAPR